MRRPPAARSPGSARACSGTISPPAPTSSLLDDPIFLDPASLGWTAAPRRYGFHATLKAPFHLAEGRSAPELEAALHGFASTEHGFDITMNMALFGGFLALVLAEAFAADDRPRGRLRATVRSVPRPSDA